MKPRVGVVVAELGIPSEVWILRQCLEFQEVEPVLLYWKMAENAVEIPSGLETRQFGTPFAPPASLWRRASRRLGSASAVLPDEAQRRDIRHTVAEASVDAVLCHFAWSGLPVSAALGGSVPVVWQVHGRDVSTRMHDPAYRRAVAKALPTVDHLVTVGTFQRDLLAPLGLTERSSVIPCGAPLAVFAQGPLPVHEAGRPFRFVSVGRLSPEKGVLESLEAFERIAPSRPDIELVFIGDGPLRPTLEAAAARSGVSDRVHLLGLQPPPVVASTLRDGHAFLQHSRQVDGWVEGFGVTLTEAGASGLPLVASRLGGIVDQVRHGENGFLFEPGDVATQAELMARLADDEALRRQMGANARRVAETFDSRLMTGRLEQVLLEAIARGSVRR
ncbi:MAG: glycosyltransferase [Phenylobacterium sp.]|uniref:glycosyltransferase family 4 protein n=1 Tax=Phenylobacterium sp. TaxID=1871053 RepID=UPI0027352B7D|nr:glycosyltransferase [Phenylobacterium sp.]MDP3747242.1 glycosyltransferase [Phenylobacterium sp.]